MAGAYDFQMAAIGGENVNLADHENTVSLIVNVASE